MPIPIDEARALYDGGATVSAVAQALGMSVDAFLRLRKKHAWPLRPSPIAASAKPARGKEKPRRAKRESTKRPPARRKTPAAPPPASAPPASVSPASVPAETAPADLAPVDIPAVRRQLENAVKVNLACVQNTLATGDAADVERNARLLASLVKSLAELRRLEALDERSAEHPGAADASEDERPPRDLETLRDELARALERMSGDAAGPEAGG